MKPIRMIMCVPKLDDATSFYRAAGPLSHLAKDMDISFMIPSSFSWATMSMNDICFMQRPADPNCLVVAEQAKLAGVPLIIEIDDDNVSVPKSNPTSEFFGQWNVKDTIIKCTRLADAVIVSTEFLKKKYSVWNKNIHVVPNAIDDRYLKFREQNTPKRPRDKVIAWRGGPGYLANLEPVAKEVIEVAKAHSAWKFIFMGNDPYTITDQIKNSQFIPWQPIMNYFSILCQIHATAFFTSVVINDHSLSRSHGPWLEASFGGGLCIAPKLPEFDRPGCLTYEGPEDFKLKLSQIINKEIDVDKMVAESWEAINEKYLLSKVNVKRKEIIQSLL